MKFFKHNCCNDELLPPIQWDHKALPCGTLPITRMVVGDFHAVASFWKPTPEELEMLNKGGSVQLTIIGQTHPPVSMEVAPPESVHET